jgi:hypothetical protein
VPVPEAPAPVTPMETEVHVYVVPVADDVNGIDTELVAEQIICGTNGKITGRGFTVILNVSGLPAQIIGEVLTDVIYNTVNGLLVLLDNSCLGIVVVPLNEAPVIPAGTTAFQVIITPLVADVMLTGKLVSPEHIV